MNSRAAFPIIVLGAALCLLLVPYSYWFGGSYALVDDFSFIVRGPLPRLAQWLTIGRPGTYFYMEFVANALNGDLPFARLMALLLLAATSLTVYFSMRYRGHVATIAIGAALAIAANYAVHLSIIWINTGSSLLSLIVATLAYATGYSSRRRIGVAITLFVLSALFYQPTACIFFVFHLLDWLLLRRERMKWSDLWPFAIGAVGLAIVFLFIKVAIIFTSVDSSWTNRGQLLHDLPGKLAFLRDRIFPFAASPVILPSWFTVFPTYAGLIALITLTGRRDFKSAGMAAIPLVIAIPFFYILAAELPILIVNDGWSSARTLVPWITLSTSLWAWIVHALLSQRLSERALVVISAAIMVTIGWSNGESTKRYLVDPAITEMNYLTAEAVRGIAAGHRDFAMIKPPPGPFDSRFGQYEFGWLSSSYSWTPRGMLIMAQRRLGLPEGSLKMVKSSREDISDCTCYVVDMRLLWNQYVSRANASQ
jgi:hypothetical protein